MLPKSATVIRQVKNLFPTESGETQAVQSLQTSLFVWR